MTADCGEDWQPATTGRERLRAQLAALRDQHKSSDVYAQGVTSQQLDDMTTIEARPEYL
jgi:hypothetical protein